MDDRVLVVVDVQNDFCPGGALAVPLGDEVIPIINEVARTFENVVLTQDWHPKHHISFASEMSVPPFETVDGITFWPDHCIQGTWGAALNGNLDIPHASLIIRKGFRPDLDSYSAFMENDHHTPTGLLGYLRERGLRRVFVAGLALDFCVRYSAEDAATWGFETVVIDDACRGIDIEGSVAATMRSFAERGIDWISTTSGELR